MIFKLVLGFENQVASFSLTVALPRLRRFCIGVQSNIFTIKMFRV